MRIFGQMVVRNEVERYLDAALSWNRLFLDELHVFDDHSTDESVELAMLHGLVVTRRPDDVPTLLQHEGKFREAAWRALEDVFDPEPGDWVLSVDADEFLMSNGNQTEYDMLYSLAQDGSERGIQGYHLPIPEVFALSELDDGMLANPHIRYDGFWNRIMGLRLMAWEPGGHWPDKAMACGSAPTYVVSTEVTQKLLILHYGYANAEDRELKYGRYSALPEGHASQHVESIMQAPLIQKWDGPYINVWRGRKSRVALDE